MNNQERAAEVIRKHNSDGICSEPECLAQDLEEAGLLAPDPPQLFFERGVGPNWEIPISDQYSGVVTVRTLGGSVFIERHGHGYGHGFITHPTEARQLAAAILAAANYSEAE